MKKIKTILLMSVAMAMNSTAFTQNSQTLLSEYWSGESGLIQTPIISTLVTKTDAMHNVYVAGATLNTTTNKLDMMVRKFNRQGDLLWTTTFGGALEEDDMAADLFIDDNYNVYVTGAIAETAQNFYDLAVIKLNSSGTVQWEYYYDYGGSPLPYDAGTAITGDNDGHIYVTGSSVATNSGSDYVIIKLESTNGNEVWTRRFDLEGLDDIPANIDFASFGGVTYILVTGASQIDENPDTWTMSLVLVDLDNTFIVDGQSGESVAGGISEVYDMTVDENDNIYIVGTKKNATTDFDVVTYKLDAQLNLIWEEVYDGYEDDDRGKGIKVDDQGNVYVAGYVTTDNEGKNYILIKYDGNGNMEWSREYNGLASMDDEAVQLVINEDNKIFVTGSAIHDTDADFVTLGYDEDGNLFNEIVFDGDAGLNDTPTNMAIDLEGNIIVVGQSQTGGPNFENVAVKYTVHEKSMDFSNEINNAHEIIVRFDTSAIIYSSIDNKKLFAGRLEKFVKQDVLDTLYQKTGFDWSRLDTYKLFRGMTTADTVSLTRLGELHRIDDFWATLSVYLPVEEDEDEVIDSLSNLYAIVHYAELNYYAETTNQPNDPLYSSGQSGLHSPVHGIEVEGAWEKQVGQTYTKVGVYDTGINWRHEDFRYPNTGFSTWANTKIAGGYDYWNYTHPQNQSNPDIRGHGTPVAGIIGALRNNNRGIAGVAGGNTLSGNTGAALYDMKIFNGIFQFIGTANVAAAIIEGAVYNPNTGYGYGFDIQNHSWSSSNYSTLFKSAVKTAFEESCIIVTGSGNYPAGNCASETCVLYPASFNDEWVIKVGANDASGSRATFSVYENNLDVIAPGTPDIYSSLDHNNNSGYSYDEPGTSFAAPHVSGVTALMHAEHNLSKGYPNNLAPEDVEYFLENFATDVLPAGYQPETGHGRVNAALSLEKLIFPDYYVLHAGGQSSPTTTSNSIEAITLLEPMYGLLPTSYIAQRTEVSYEFVEVLPVGQTAIDYWPRFSSSKGLDSNPLISADTWMDMNVSVNQNVITVSTTTNCWYVIQQVLFGQPVNKWIPAPPSELKTSFSLYVEDPNSTANVEEEILANGVTIYPNPSDDQITIDYSLSEKTAVQLEIIDATGRKIATHTLKNQSIGSNSLTISVAHLSKGMYICNLHIGGERISRKIIKN